MKIKNTLGSLAAALLVVNQFFSFAVFAQEFSVSGNGEGSSNSISYEVDRETQIYQTNSADIDNDVGIQAQTGGNEANNNTGETGIETGDISEEIEIINSGNSSTAEIGCCEADEPSSASIEGNGADSDNSIKALDNSTQAIDIVNELKLNNNVSIHANTGDNEADDNDGDVTIQTGTINLLAQVLNQNLNTADVTAGSDNKSFNYAINNNGSGSTNSIYEENNTENGYFVFNSLSLTNDINNYSNTGGNRASKNNGRVFISTGNIYLDIILSNKDINISKIIDNCCLKAIPTPPPAGGPTPTPTGTPEPSMPPSGSPSPTPTSSCCTPTNDPPGPPGGSGGPGGGEVLGASLPATGGASLWVLTALALLMMVSGVILRSDYAENKYKKVFGKFTDSLRYYAFGAYLFANLKNLPAGKA